MALFSAFGRIAACALFLGVYCANAGAAAGPRPAARDGITVYTEDAQAFGVGGAAAELMRRAQSQGEIRVIVGLRTVMRMEHTLAPRQLQRQRQSLQRLQNTVLGRVFGTILADGVTRYHFIPYISVWADASQIQRLLTDPAVVSVQEDVPVQAQLADSTQIVHATDLWSESVDGRGETVAIIDSGVDKAHAMLKGKVVAEGCYSTNSPRHHLQSACPGGVTESTAAGSGVYCPLTFKDCDHGTHVASIAAGSVNKGLKGGVTLYGVARSANIIAIQAATLDTSKNHATFFASDWIKGLERVYALRQTYAIDAANMSLAGGNYTGPCDDTSPAGKTAIDNLRAAGIATTVASGNDSFTFSIAFPACISSAIAVGNTTKTDFLNSTSDHSTQVKLLAPGTDIHAAVPGNKYAAKTGTSMAAPHVAGAFALLRDASLDASIDDMLQALTCSGKMIVANEVGATIHPPKPRIDLLGAYLYLVKPAGAERLWQFGTDWDALDWTTLAGTWRINKAQGWYTPERQPGRAMIALANCSSFFQVSARMRQTEPTKNVAAGGSLWIKAAVDPEMGLISGYRFTYGAAQDFSYVEIDRYTNFDYISNECKMPFQGGNCTLSVLCYKENVGVKQGAWTTLIARTNGSSHQLFLNSTANQQCSGDDATYATGSIVVDAVFGDPLDASFAVDSVDFKPMDTAPVAMNPVMDPAAVAHRLLATIARGRGTLH
ncbi:MAG TPA: S8 family serine peptidase [Rhizomicrobium sp.]